MSGNTLAANSGLILILLIALVLILIGVVIWLAMRQRRLEAHYRALTTGVETGNLETILNDHMEQVRRAQEKTVELDTLARRLEREGRTHIQRVGFRRFNPFRDAGGDQSFALALADLDGNGVVISSLHSRESTRVYGKPLAAWQSPYPLTDEEQAVIEQARVDAR